MKFEKQKLLLKDFNKIISKQINETGIKEFKLIGRYTTDNKFIGTVWTLENLAYLFAYFFDLNFNFDIEIKCKKSFDKINFGKDKKQTLIIDYKII